MEDNFPHRASRWVRDANNFAIFANTEKKISYISRWTSTYQNTCIYYVADLSPLLTHEDLGTDHKLVDTVHAKERYVVHVEMLKLVVKLDVVVTKIHLVLRFIRGRIYVNT